MKKLVLLLAVVFSASLFSCGNAEKAEAAADTVAVVEEVAEEVIDTTNVAKCGVDSCACDTCACDSVKCCK